MLLKNCTKGTSILPTIQKSRFQKKYLMWKSMEYRDYLLFSLIISKIPWRNWFRNIWSSILWHTTLHLPLHAKNLELPTQWTAKTPPENIKKSSSKSIHTSFVKKHAKNYSNYRETSLLHMHINDENQSNHFATQTLVTYVKTQEVL